MERFFISLLISLFVCLPSFISADETHSHRCEKHGFEKSVLNMDVDWVIQGRYMKFSGFFIEYLGISSSIRDLLPQSRVTQSFFRFNLSESPIQNPSHFFEELFERESANIQYLRNNNQPAYPESGYSIHPKLLAYGNRTPAAMDPSMCDFTDTSTSINQETNTNQPIDPSLGPRGIFNSGKHLKGRDLMRSIAPADSQSECCHACRRHPLCVGWNYEETHDTSETEAEMTHDKRNICVLKANTIQPLSVESVITSINSTVGWVGRQSIEEDETYNEESTESADANDRSSLSINSLSSISSGAMQPYRYPRPTAVIFHGTSCFHKNRTITSSKRDINMIYIGRYMMERSSFSGGFNIDEYSVAACASAVDEVWVPTQWHREVFVKFMLAMGMPAPNVEVIPEAVDTELFAPTAENEGHQLGADSTTVASSQRPLGRGEKYCEYSAARDGNVTCSSIDDGDNDSSSQSNLTESTLRFEFLSIFKWEFRKGWDVLLRAYWTAFTKSDHVLLRVKSYVPNFERKLGGTANITRAMETFAQDTFGKPLSELAAVVWDNELTSRAGVRDLLQSVDAFVLPTRGEGWGLPIAEAMSMQLPVIVTGKCPGPAAYATDSNAYLIRTLSQQEMEQDGGASISSSFVEPDAEHLSELMRKSLVDSFILSSAESVDEISVYGRVTVAKRKGIEARKAMQQYSPDSIVCAINERLRIRAKATGWEFP